MRRIDVVNARKQKAEQKLALQKADRIATEKAATKA